MRHKSYSAHLWKHSPACQGRLRTWTGSPCRTTTRWLRCSRRRRNPPCCRWCRSTRGGRRLRDWRTRSTYGCHSFQLITSHPIWHRTPPCFRKTTPSWAGRRRTRPAQPWSRPSSTHSRKSWGQQWCLQGGTPGHLLGTIRDKKVLHAGATVILVFIPTQDTTWKHDH